MNTKEIWAIVDRVEFPGWTWNVTEMGDHPHQNEGWTLQAYFQRPDANTREIVQGETRKEFLSPGVTEDGVVKTCWVIVELTTRHEAMEFFTYKGARVFDPHTPVAALIGLQEHKEKHDG